MEIAGRLIAFLVGFGFLAGAMGFIVTPAMMEPDFSIAATRIDGMGTLRADIGGAFAGLALFTFLGMRRSQAQWLLVPLAFMAVYLVIRLGHLAVDGVTANGIRSTVVEIVLVALCYAAYRVLSRANRS
jgi:hypothetical protein